MRKALFLLALIAGLFAWGCAGEMSELDRQTLKNAREFLDALEDYSLEYTYYPEELEELVPRYMVKMPVNPHTGGPMTDTQSEDFDPATSPGNVYYGKVHKDGVVVNFHMLVFGEKKQIGIYRRSPNAAM